MSADDPIRRIVVLMLENRSFDQMLGGFQEVYPDLDGVDTGAQPRTNRDSAGASILQGPIERLQVMPDPKHEHANVLRQLEDDNGGFIQDYLASYRDAATEMCPAIMGYFRRGFLPALHRLAEQFTVCDRWFSSVPGPTWPNRMFALSGTSNGCVLMPSGVHNLRMLWSQSQDTIFDRLDEAGRSWGVYFYDFPTSLLLRHQRHPRNLARYHLIDRFFTEAAGIGAVDDLPDFVFIEPKYFGEDQNDDHPPHNVMKGQKLIADVYNAIRGNEKLWKSTLLVVAYDEHGGFYDHVAPPSAVPPDTKRDEYTFDRYGVRVPVVLVSPWLEARVEHTMFDHTSVLKYIIDKWKLGMLGERTRAANSIACAFRGTNFRHDTNPFIRVPNTLLIAPDSDLERRHVMAHHDAIHLLADVLEAPDESLPEATERAARASLERALRLPKIQAGAGDRLIAWGRKLREPLERAQDERIQKSIAAMERARNPP